MPARAEEHEEMPLLLGRLYFQEQAVDTDHFDRIPDAEARLTVGGCLPAGAVHFDMAVGPEIGDGCPHPSNEVLTTDSRRRKP